MRIHVPLVALCLLVPACGGDEPTVTAEERLERVIGEDLTPAEVQRRLDVADILCRSDLTVLDPLWSSLSATQMRFQDYVFSNHCPERSVDYALATGRVLTPAAHEALDGVDTTAPPTTEPTSRTLPLPTTGSTTTVTGAGSESGG